ncbi:MAG: CRISPR-associated protein [Leptolyngbyaceae cyanobacterium CSU_1_3]|nr:CRISPR-associated protein [Leptolyngbyaceae cyanobacterium CSU_1_3]
MRNTLSQALKIVFSPETILPFLVGSVFLAVFGNAIYDIFKNLFGSSTPDLVRIAVLSLLILAIAVGSVSWVISRRIASLEIDVPFEVQQKQLEQKYRGLVLLVSQKEACETAMRFHLPVLQRCWLICSRERLDMAQQLCQEFPQICVDAPLVVNDIYNPLEFQSRVNEIYQTRLPKNWTEADVIADYTGMTAHASVGVVLACVGTKRSIQYTPAKVDAQGKVVGSLNPIRVILGFQANERSNASSKLAG